MSKYIDEVGRCDPPTWGSYLCIPVPGWNENNIILPVVVLFQSDVFIIIFRPVEKKWKNYNNI